MSAVFIRRPVATVLLSLGILLIGLVSLGRFGISAMPSANAPVIRVSGGLPGADADTVASTLTAPLERRLGQIPGVRNLTSQSRAGSSNITVEFTFGRDIDAAARDVQAAINAAGSDLPADLKRPPTYRKLNPSAMPIVTLALSSGNLPSSTVYDIAETEVVPRLSQVAGVGDVTVSGAERMAIRVRVDPAHLAALDLSFQEVRSALAGANSTNPRGEVHGDRLAYEFAVDGQLLTAEDYRNLVVANRHKTPVRLGDVATVIEAAADARTAARYNGRPAVLVNVARLPDANIVDTSDRVLAALDQIRGWLPPGVGIDVQSERTAGIRATVDHVGFIIGLTIALAVAVVAVFLRRFWATAIPAVAIPVALAGTLAVILQFGFTLNVMSLMALTVAIGFIVDDAIVVVDAVAHRRDRGEGMVEAALGGARQVGFTIVSMSMALVAAFIPLLFMEDFIGRMLLEFSVTVVVAIAVSAVVSLTLTPTLCGRLMAARPDKERGPGRFLRAYGRALRFALRHRFLALLVTLGCVWLIGVLNAHVPQGFFPRQDTGNVSAFIEGPQDISFKAMNERVKAVEALLLADPGVLSVSASVGSGRSGSINIVLKPEGERSETPDEIAARLRPALARINGVTVYLIVEQDARGGSRPDRAEFEYSLVSDDLSSLTEWTQTVYKRLRELPQLADVGTDMDVRSAQAELTVDREAAARLGVSMSAIDTALNDAFGQREVSTILTNRDQYPVILEAAESFGQEPERLRDVYVRQTSGEQIPLSAVARLDYGVSPLSVNHRGGFVSSSLSFNVAPGYALSDATKAVRDAVNALMLPENVRGSLRGDAETFARHQSNQPMLLLIAVVAIYIVLGVLYESLAHPITIVSTLPPATVGAMGALAATQTQLSIVAMIGIILVIGIVMKNAIILVDYAQEARRRGLSPEEAVFEAGLLRFRPILMTTLTTLIGALVVAIDHGSGSELRRPLGVAMAGGLAFAQIVTMFSAPVIYVWMSGGWLRRPRWLRRRGGQAVAGASSPETGTGLPNR
jgi:hydrophobe/amphiphile efflux-1 (HAE1) family protein